MTVEERFLQQVIFLNGNRLVVPQLSFEQPQQNVIQTVHYSSVPEFLFNAFTEVFLALNIIWSTGS